MNNRFTPYLLDGQTADWIVASFPIVRVVLVALIALCAIIMIVTTLLQSNNNENANNALSGGVQESYYAKNKGESKNVKLSRATVACISIIAVCVLLYCLTFLFYKGSL